MELSPHIRKIVGAFPFPTISLVLNSRVSGVAAEDSRAVRTNWAK